MDLVGYIADFDISRIRPAHVMTDYRQVFEAIVADPGYQRNLDWGEERPGHPEGTIRAHIAEVERNLETLRPKLSDVEYWKLKVLVHVHDTFKREARPGAAIAAPESHASLARAFLARHCDEGDLLAIVQYHDEPYALWRRFKAKGRIDEERLGVLLAAIEDWDLFLAFSIIDGCTPGKSREPLHWWFQQIEGKVQSRFTAADIL
jgi:hypothetical protein